VSASSKKGLGRGFESLIPTDLLDESFDPTATQDEQISELRQIKIDQIVADPDQPRRQFDEAALEELAASIAEHGILQPIVVTPHGNGYQIVAGERRYRAAKIAGLGKIPTLVRTLSGQHKLELSLIENLQRRDLNIIETGTAYLKLQNQFNLSLSQIGERVGKKSVSTISNTMRLLKLPQSVKEALAEGKVNEGQVRPLIGLDDKMIESLLPRIIREGWTARDAEIFIGRIKQAESANEVVRPKVFASPYDQETRNLAKRFITKVTVQTNTKGAGQIVIKFKDDDDFRRIQSLLDT
jgi:ParB family transcriptional regulator, chromosome partitioning protein